jgi:hypothetical protein
VCYLQTLQCRTAWTDRSNVLVDFRFRVCCASQQQWIGKAVCHLPSLPGLAACVNSAATRTTMSIVGLRGRHVLSMDVKGSHRRRRSSSRSSSTSSSATNNRRLVAAAAAVVPAASPNHLQLLLLPPRLSLTPGKLCAALLQQQQQQQQHR